MSESFKFEASRSVAATGTTYLDLDEAAWQPAGVAGFWMKPLAMGLEGGVESWLMKVEPGAVAPEHSHDHQWEQVYILEGTLSERDRTLKAGDFACRAPGTAHSGGSETGALVLLVYSNAQPSA